MLATLAAFSLVQATPSVKFEAVPGGWQLLRDGRPYHIKGAGAGPEMLATIKRLGANSVRTWGVDENSGAFLDRAHKLGLSVTVGYWMRKEDGFNYDKASDLESQEAEVRKWVRAYRKHPAVLMWAVGNEQELGTPWPQVWKQTERLAKAVKEEDPHHPVISVVADMWPDKMRDLLAHAPSLDAIGVNSYDGLPSLMDRMKDWKKPILITEFSFSLPSQDPKAPWAGFVEPGSQAKADSLARNFKSVINAHPKQVLGSYFFYFGKSKVATESLHSVYLSTGEKLAIEDVLAREWQGPAPANRPPSLQLVEPSAPFRIAPGAKFQLSATATDPDRNRVTLEYELLPNDPKKRFIGDFEQKMGTVAKARFRGKAKLVAPSEPGLYRVLVVARDGKGAAATESRSFLVTAH